jgi:membrane fusion protein, multidrug efflux system
MSESSEISPTPRSFVRRVVVGSVRLVLLILVPAVGAVLGLELYVASGRTVTTENAYVKADKVAVSADLTGRVVDVNVSTHSHVSQGDILFSLDPRPFEIAYARAEAELGVVENDIRGYQAIYEMESARLSMANQDLAFYEREYERQQKLSKGGLVSKAKIDQSLHDMQMSRERIGGITQAINSALTRMGGEPEMDVTAHPEYLRAVAARDDALLNLDRTVVRAPVSGFVSSVELQPGEYVEDGKPVFSIVSDLEVWVIANLKETELTHIVVGQAVSLQADAYPDRRFGAIVDSIAPATGAEFSLLPPQNASGNWVKVVQRVPVRISLFDETAKNALRVGMSVHVSINTGQERRLPEILGKAMAFVRANQDRVPFLKEGMEAMQNQQHTATAADNAPTTN